MDFVVHSVEDIEIMQAHHIDADLSDGVISLLCSCGGFTFSTTAAPGEMIEAMSRTADAGRDHVIDMVRAARG